MFYVCSERNQTKLQPTEKDIFILIRFTFLLFKPKYGDCRTLFSLDN